MDDILIESSGSSTISKIIPKFGDTNYYDNKVNSYAPIGYSVTCAPPDLEVIADKFSQEIERLEGRMHKLLEEKDWTISFLERRVVALEALVFEMKRQLEDSVPRVLLSKEDAPFVDLLADLEGTDDD